MSTSIMLDRESLEILQKYFKHNSLAMAVSHAVRHWYEHGMPHSVFGRVYKRDESKEWQAVRFTIDDTIMHEIRMTKSSAFNLSETMRAYLSTFI